MEVPVSLNLQNLPLLPRQSLNKDSKHWNSIIKHHTKLKDDHAILNTHTQMEALGISPDNSVLPLVLKACGRLQAIEKGKRIHNDICNTDLINDVRVRTALVDFYCKCGFHEIARYLFDEMNERDVVSWNAMISGYVGCSLYEEAIGLFFKMQQEKLKPNSVTAVTLLSACGELLEMGLGKEIHGFCLRNGLFDSNPHVGTALIGFYMRFDVRTSSLVFEMMGLRNTVSWNAMVSGYFDEGDSLKTLKLFRQMIMDGVKFDSITMLVVIQACTELGFLKLGMQVHQLVIKFDFHKDLYIANSLVNMYGKNGSLESALDLFESIPTRDVALWNSMISVFVEIGSHEEAMSLFTRMRLEGTQENERTILILLSLCADSADGLRNGESLHALVIKSGMERITSVGNSLLNLYTQLNCVEDSLKVYNEIRDPDAISWNTLILALAHSKLKGQAWELFRQMQESDTKPNAYTIISILAVCENETFLNIGRSIHGYLIKHGIEIKPSLNTALTEMYMNCKDEATAVNLFESCTDRDLISWNALITSYIKNSQSHKAMLLFRCMISEVEPNSTTIINLLSSCTHLANLPQGRCLHAYTIRRESSWGFDLSLANAFITMYARCGSMQYAEKIFKTLPRKNIVTWNAMIAGYGMHGRGFDAMIAFSQMLEGGFKPNGITFVSALSACSHSGLIQEGLQLFHSMVQDFSIAPELVHYSCVVDLLGRGGCIDEARKFINSMPIEPDVSVWRALLGACRVFSETKLAKGIFEKLIELEPTNAGNYVLLSNIYAAAGLWSEVRKLRILLEEKGLKKPAGRSWMIVKNEVHCFTAGDKSHPQSDKIYAKLSSLLPSIKKTGYVPDLHCVLHDEEDDKKIKRLFSHSEKLAIAFGLISVSGGNPILITKNLRVCGDCHEFSKCVSKFSGREIVIRDRSRYHHFINGVCSCKDYW
ncbi:pentatricopeptide repeat-containing protein At5g04780, mitochondrial-like [Cornus florida]|uniref:pentatricopeptide repeat-containing protein At5g04780, mitochondrial-like n=1 Tax=Cornus florida TaxID=4283 RepID=UPI002898960F|nr:pentatricopeptide repeat-containing protein At5g04780, mitochondrial-like [Cornus florida]